MTVVDSRSSTMAGPARRAPGPAIVEERESTTVIGPNTEIRVDAQRTLIAEPAAPEAR